MFLVILLLSIFPLFITYKTSTPDLKEILWQLRHFIGIAVIQAFAQMSLSWYVLNNKVPNYVVASLLIMVMFFQVTYGIAVILVSNA